VIISDDLESCTKEVHAFGCLHPDGSGRKVVLVDTPGFDDTERADYAILKVIARWLKSR
jgi:predicted GTPase